MPCCSYREPLKFIQPMGERVYRPLAKLALLPVRVFLVLDPTRSDSVRESAANMKSANSKCARPTAPSNGTRKSAEPMGNAV